MPPVTRIHVLPGHEDPGRRPGDIEAILRNGNNGHAMTHRNRPIDPGKLTKAQLRGFERVQTIMLDIGASMSQRHQACLDAVRDSLDRMLEANADAPFLVDMFVALELAATQSKARLIAEHPLRPGAVDKALQRKREENDRPAGQTAGE